jgi:hypothetical protein
MAELFTGKYKFDHRLSVPVISLLKLLAYMPDYLITVHMKVGPPKQGTRWFASHDFDRVKFLVGQRVKETIGTFLVERIDVVLVEEQGKEIRDYSELPGKRRHI